MKTWSDFGIDLGTKSGIEVKVTCPQCSPHRKKKNFPCLNANTEIGVWNCWHCGWSGTLKGGEWKRPEIVKAYTRPAFVKAEPKAVDELMRWFEARGITREVVERNGITKGVVYFPQVEGELPAIMFPYHRGSDVINVKYRSKEKYFRMASGAERVLYGINDIGETLVWVEGEVDKLSVEVAGTASCVSVPDGAPAVDSKDYSNKFDFLKDPALDAVKTHIIAVDNDGPGVRLKDELCRRLGAEKCMVVTWPAGSKDANDVLIQHGVAALTECLAKAQPIPIAGTYNVRDMMNQLADEYVHGVPKGLDIGWTSLANMYRIMAGEWTLVTGIPGDGKSEWLDALTMNLAKMHGWTFGIFSPENQPLTYHVQKLAEKYVGKPFGDGRTERMNETEFEEAMNWLDAHYTFISPEAPTLDELLDIARQLVLRKGIRGLILDPWNEIFSERGSHTTETEMISLSLTKIRTFARNNGVHVWLVAHPTKLRKEANGEYPVPTPYDVSGSAHWRNKADCCVAVFRDQKAGNAEVQIHIQKIRKRANGRVGVATLLWDHVSGQYRDDIPSVMPRAFAKKHLESV